MYFKPVIQVNQVSKLYPLYKQPSDRLKQFLWRGKKQFFKEFWALKNITFEVAQGEVIGIIGSNGAGKSTLLQLICGTLKPTSGEINVNGRVAALLELGAGFNPEFSGRENIFMNAAILGLSRTETENRIESIIDFSGVRDFIDQPVKTYSSGMYVRLAFAVATSVDPDILVIDEALSVGDGAFARKSFDRIMELKNAGKTILFCSHALYQIEAICDRVLWLNKGIPQMNGLPADTISAYSMFLDRSIEATSQKSDSDPSHTPSMPILSERPAYFKQLTVSVDGVSGKNLNVVSGKSTVSIKTEFRSDPSLPAPTVAVMFHDHNARPVASSGTHNDQFIIQRDSLGNGEVTVYFEKFPLLKGQYSVYVFLMCENGIHFYEQADQIAQLNVQQHGLEIGVVALPHYWD